MYVPPHFRQDDPELIRWVIQSYSFGTMITAGQQALKVTHLPCLFDASRGEHGVIRAHVAKANDHWKAFKNSNESVIIFQGPHAYVSPTLYKEVFSVPTWNYAAVHVYGAPVILESAASFKLLTDMLRTFEGPDSSYDYTAGEAHTRKLLPGIVAFEMPILRIEAKFKLSQNKTEVDRAAVVAHLLGASDQTERALGELMERIRSGS